jgi:protein TonB
VASPASNASRSVETGTPVTGTAGGSTGPGTRPSVDVTAITTRDDFLLELGEALGGQASVRPVDSIAPALEYLKSTKRGQVLVIDTRDVIDVRADVELAHEQASHAVVLVFASTDAEKAVSAAVKGTNVLAVLSIPVDKRKASAVLEGAMADAVAKKGTARAATSGTGLTVESFQPQAESAAADEAGDGKGKMAVMAGAGVAVVALAAGAFWFFTKDNGGPPAPPTAGPPAQVAAPTGPEAAAPAPDASLGPTPAVETSLVKGKVDELLEKARLSMKERRYTEPTGDNALLYYRSAAAADPNNGEAKDGLQRVAGVLASRFEESITAGKYDEAALALANLKVASPDDQRAGPFELRLMTAQISKALTDGNMDRAVALVRQAQQSAAIPADQITKWRADIARRQEDAKVAHFANLVSDRIRDGKLNDPPEDSAKTYVGQLRDAAPSNPITQRAIRELNSAFLRKAREASLAKNNADVDRWIAEARAGGVGASEIAAFQHDLAAQRAKAAAAESDRLIQLARDRMRDGRLTDPAQDSTAYYLGQLVTSDPNNANLAQVGREFAGKLIDHAKASVAAGKTAVADADLTQAKRWGADPKDIAAVQSAMAARTAPPPSLARAPVASAGGGTSAASLAASLHRTKYVPPEFPPKALSQKISGSVTVEYIVDTNGDPRDVRVVEATPPGVFDHAAINAVKRWHYEPVSLNGAPVEVPVRTSIRFELPK